MANFFLGFPVPRAKIADMIEGAAPPLEHKENHHPDGSDPLALPTDIDPGQLIKWDGAKFVGIAAPTGGITFPWDDFIFHTHLESLDGFYTSTAGTGAITLNHDNLELTTGGATADRAYILKQTDYPHINLTWNKRRMFLTRVLFDLSSGVDARYYIAIGQPLTEQAVGFRVENGLLEAYIKVPGGTETSTLEDWSGTPTSYNRVLAIDHNPPAYPKFYVNGSLVYTADTRCPDGSSGSTYIIYCRVYHPAIGDAQRLIFSEWMFWQAA